MPTPERARRSVGPAAFLLSLPVLVASPAAAVDGVLEISQACVSSGCIAGDASGFPVQIGASGSYRLTSDLSLPNSNTTAVQVQAGAQHVSIDLNGFRIFCPVCAAGTGVGIDAAAGVELSVSNGVIAEVGNAGINAAGRLRVERVTMSTAHGHGIRTTGTALVSDCTVYNSNGNGIDVGPDSIVTRSVVRSNGQSGIRIDSGIVSESLVQANGAFGIVCDLHCTAHGNTVTGNGSQGVLADQSNIQRNVVSGNGDFGIDSFRSVVVANGLFGNDRQGLNASTSTGYGSNHFEANNSGGAQVSLGIQIDPNGCGSGLCP